MCESCYDMWHWNIIEKGDFRQDNLWANIFSTEILTHEEPYTKIKLKTEREYNLGVNFRASLAYENI